MNRPTRIAAVVALVAAVLVVANRWRGHSERSPPEPTAATPRAVEDERTDADVAAAGAHDTRSSEDSLSIRTPTTEDAAEVSRDSVPADQDFEVLVAGIDPSLRERNLIQRAPRSGRTGPAFGDLERRFSAETTDANWSDGMEARILDQVSQIPGLRLASIDAECRATICRVKLFYPPNTNAFSSLEKLQPIATQIGFGEAAEVATIGDDGVPISLLYFQRDDA